MDSELERLFGPANRAALIGQLGNLVLAKRYGSPGGHINSPNSRRIG